MDDSINKEANNSIESLTKQCYSFIVVFACFDSTFFFCCCFVSLLVVDFINDFVIFHIRFGIEFSMTLVNAVVTNQRMENFLHMQMRECGEAYNTRTSRIVCSLPLVCCYCCCFGLTIYILSHTITIHRQFTK